LTQSSLAHLLLTGATPFLPPYLIHQIQHHPHQITSILTPHHINQPKTNFQNNLNSYFNTPHLDKLIKHIHIILAHLSQLHHLIIHSPIDTIIHPAAPTDHF
ncbi:Rossmann-fold NAD(P)-binding domain-containing protein, partial [Staphylococcus epidermidis]|uniref:hypothetical protein n=1 Tax=Staphylococcus epidermidis TaxID=1282 RepID=UPI00164254BF